MKKSLFILLAIATLFMVACDERGSGTITEEPDPATSYKITSIIANPDQIYAGAQGYDSTIIVSVKDANDYAVPSHPVKFKVLPGGPGGTVDYQVMTDSMGIAKATYSNDVMTASGRAIIEASVPNGVSADTVGVVVIPSEDNGVDQYSLQFENTTPIELTVQGGGGDETESVSVLLYKNDAIYMEDDIAVHWLLPYAPTGANINGVPSVVGGSDEDAVVSPTLNGKASVNINSGSKSGTASIRAFCDVVRELPNGDLDTLRVQAQRANINIFAGEPESFTINFAEGATVDENGTTAGFWDIEIAAQVNDAYGNAIQYGTAVSFSITQAWNLNGDSLIVAPDFDPVDWVSVVANSYTGNPNAEGDSMPGMAYSKLIFDGSHSNDSIRVMVEVGGITSSEVLVLPMGELDLQFESEKGHCTVNYGDPDSTAVFVNLRDTQGNRIHNAHIYLVCDWGEFTFSNYLPGVPQALAASLPDGGNYHHQAAGFAYQPAEIYSNVNGFAKGYWYVPGYQFLPPDQNGQPQDRQAQLRAIIYENEIDATVEVVFRAYPPGIVPN